MFFRTKAFLTILLFVPSGPALMGQELPQPREVQLKAADGLMVYGDLYQLDPTRPTILLLHQGESNARGEYRRVLPRLLDYGFNVFALDQRVGGGMYGSSNRTVAGTRREYDYCDAYDDIVSALRYLLESVKARGVVVWGSSYSATLALKLAAEHPNGIQGLIGFSPAGGEPMKGCPLDEVLLSRVRVRGLILLPAAELDSNRLSRMQLLAKHGFPVYVASLGTHGSSLLDSERAGGNVEPTWSVVRSFLESSTPQTVPSHGLEESRVRQVLHEIIEANRTQSIADVDRLYGDDAILLPPLGTEIKGKEAILEHYRHLFNGTERKFDFDVAEVQVFGTSALIRGVTRGEIREAASGRIEKASSLFIMLLAKHGPTWRISHLMWNKIN